MYNKPYKEQNQDHLKVKYLKKDIETYGKLFNNNIEELR